VDLNLDEFRKSVRARVSQSETLAQALGSVLSPRFSEMLPVINNFKVWAENCRDAVTSGHIMSWLQANIVMGIRIWIYWSPTLKLFAYICERERLSKEQPLPPALKALLNDSRIGAFVWHNKRPTTLADCEKGIEWWKDGSRKTDNSVATRIFISHRC